MSSPIDRMGAGKPEDRGPNLAWSALFVVASLLGGLAAADLTHESAFIAVLFSLGVALVMVILLYQGLLNTERPAGGPPGGPSGGPGRGSPYGDRAGPPAARSYGAETAMPGSVPDPQAQPAQPVQPGAVRVVQPRSGGGAGGTAWWEGHAAAASGGRGAQSAGPRKVDLSLFLDQALIAQCPRCGAFSVDVDNRAAEWLFGCQECRQRWTWQPGRPWPAIHVRPEARGRTDRPRGES